MSESRFLTKKHLEDARSRIEPFINQTPLLSNSWINNQCSCKIWFKCENFQKTGSFKVRGAANKICNLKKASSICAHSSGNHAQAVAYVAKQLGLKAKIVMPYDTP
jgi:threonine dehydratase